MSALTRILAPVDGSPSALRAVIAADALARASAATLDIVTVVDLRSLDLYEQIGLTEEQIASLEQRVRASVLSPALEHTTSKGRTARLLKGPIERTLLDEARGASLVVVGRTGKGALERMLEGSVSRRLVQSSTVPVMVVP